MRVTGSVVVLLLAIALPASAGDAAATKQEFNRFCSKCHGTGGKGDGPQADALVTKPRDFTDCARMKGITDEVAFKAIKEGGESVGLSKDMPAWKDGMEDDEIRDLVAYVRTFCKQ